MKKMLVALFASLFAASAFAEESKLEVSGIVNWTTAYVDHGYVSNDSGLIIQPNVDLGYKLESIKDLDVTAHLNLWSNVTDKKYDRVDYWDELDITPYLDIKSGRFTFSPQYSAYYSPANNFDTTHEIGLTVAFDDTGVWSDKFSLQPYVFVSKELNEKNRTFWKVGIEPTFKVQDISSLTFSIPASIAGGLNNYYSNSSGDNSYLGFAEIGIAAKYQLNETFYVQAEVDYYLGLSDSVKDNYDGNNKLVGTIGIGFDF